MKKIIFRLESATQLIDAITVGNLKEISEKIKSYDFSQYNLFWLSDGNFPKTVRVNAVLFYEAKVSINNRNLFGRILFDMEKARIVIETSENVHVPYCYFGGVAIPRSLLWGRLLYAEVVIDMFPLTVKGIIIAVD